MAAQAVEGTVVTALRAVVQRARQAAERSNRRPDDVRLVAVGKTKPNSLIRQLYDAGHRVFGENYVQELIDKAPQLPVDIEWHFIGHLQSNKVKPLLAAVPNLDMIEGVDSEKVTYWPLCYLFLSALIYGEVIIKIPETAKSGVDPSDCVEIAKYISLGCMNLRFSGLMTIGMPDYSSTPENFQTLLNCRDEVCKTLGMAESECELSMGMSNDFEQAIEMGSTNVRVGSTIFGPRDYPKKQSN